MLSKYSVKKPFTVLVVVILIIVFGIVSFSKSTMDLFPSIDLPYVVVMTTYPGAAPEQIETNVTEPLEQQMASLENLKNVTSTSSENYSMIILEFNDSADLSTVSVDIRDKIDLVSGSFDDSVEKPIIFKMNPDMMPVVIAAVSVKDKSIVETSKLIEENVQRKLEGIDGVANVTAASMVENTVHVSLNQDKIDAKNKEIKKAATKQIDSGVNQLNSGINQSQSAESQIENGKTKIEEAQKELVVKKEVVSEMLTLLENLLIAKESLTVLDPTADTSKLDAKIKEVLENLKPYKKDLKTVGIDLNKATKTSINAAMTVSTFNIIMNISSDQLGNQMSESTSMEAYLKSTNNQLQSQKSQLESQKETVKNSVDISSLLTKSGISSIISSQNFEMPAGYVSDDGNDIMVTVGDKITDIDDLENLVLMDTGIDGVEPIKVKDVATVSYMNNSGDTYAKINGKDGVLLTFNKQSNYSTSEVATNIKEKFSKLENEYDGLNFTVLSDQGKYIKLVIDSVLENLLFGALLAILILLFFLRDIKPTLITACSIPISVTFALVLMYFSGVTLNVISVAGLAVGVGMLVDNSIVVIENIYRLRNLGYSKRKAAITGASQVSGAITASTLTTICVFVPIVFIEGVTRQIFIDMALTIAYSLLASLFIALTLVPAMGKVLLNKTKKNTVLNRDSKYIKKYREFLWKVLNRRAIVIVLAVILLLGSFTLVVSRGFEYMPSMASEEISVKMVLPEDTDQDKCIGIYDSMASKIQKIKGVKTVGVMLDSDTNSIMGMSMSEKDFAKMDMYVLLEDGYISKNKIISKKIEKIGQEKGGEVTVSGDTDMTTYVGGDDISLQVYSDNLDDLRLSSAKIEKKLGNIKGLTQVSDAAENTIPEIKISVNKNKAIKKGLTTASIYAAISSKLLEEKTATQIKYNGNNRNVVVEDNGSDTITRKKLLNTKLRVVSMTGSTVTFKIKDYANITEDKTLNTINRNNQKRSIKVTASLKDGYNTTKMTSKAEKAVDRINMPDGVEVEFSGQNEAIMDAMKQLVEMLLLGILMIYLIMVAQFQSLKSPFIVMFTVPLAFTGGLIGLLVTGFEISVISMIGFVVLTGIIVNNAIVLIDYINQLVKDGMEKREAIVEAASTRIRPILMTALTTVLGLLPLTLGIGSGAEMMQPVAIVCVGGLLYATLMTLIVIPIMYDSFNRKKIKIFSKRS